LLAAVELFRLDGLAAFFVAGFEVGVLAALAVVFLLLVLG
jgi:hypothetical protein